MHVLGVRIDRLTHAEAVERVDALLADPAPATLNYVNAHSLNLAVRHTAYRSALAQTDLLLNDGVGLSLAGRVKQRAFPTNLNGSDFTPVILERAVRLGLRVAFYGGRPGVADTAAANLRRGLPDLDVVATVHGYGGRDAASVAGDLAAARPDVLLVALGNPLQELWLDAHLGATGARLGSGVGAFFDFAADRVPRAPAWMNRTGVEWLWRLGREPRRMWRRYLIGNPVFLARLAREAYAERRGHQPDPVGRRLR